MIERFMSESLSTVEIEDVLSSIRRLVSEDLRPTHKLVTAALQAGAAKLILTPALRVVTNDQPGFVHTADDLDEPGDLQSVLEKIDGPDVGSTAEMMPMFGSVRLQEMADVRADDAYGGDVDTAADANFLATAMSRINGLSAAEMPPATAAEAIEAVGAAVGPEEWEVDGGEPAPQAKAWTDAVWNSADAPDVLTERDRAAEPLVLSGAIVAADDSDAPFAHVDLADSTSPAGHDLHTRDSVVDGNLADDVMGQDNIVFNEGAVLPQTSAGEQELADGQLQTTKPESNDAADADDGGGFLNEDLLREIVRDMIQAELQGTLGERITRNVRKLVRAEINRALMSRDYE